MWQQELRMNSTVKPGERHLSPKTPSPRGGFMPQRRGRGRNRGGGRGGRSRGGNGKRNNFHAERNSGETFQFQKKRNFYCCSCDRDFDSSENLEKHNSEHIVCGLEGCQFEAQALVVTKHIKMQHSGNLYSRMKNVNTPEEISAWREERRKHFPTKQQLTDEASEGKERIERKKLHQNEKTLTRSNAKTEYRYKINAKMDPNFSYGARRLRQIEYEQSDQWQFQLVPSSQGKDSTRVPLASRNKSPIVCLESFYLNVKLRKDGRLQKEKKVKWKGFKVKTLEKLTDSESETESANIPISDDKEAVDGGKERRLEGNTATLEFPSASTNKKIAAPPSVFGSLFNYSSASEGEDDQGDQAKSERIFEASRKGAVVIEDSTAGKGVVKNPSDDDSSSDDGSIVIEEFTERRAPPKRKSIAHSFGGGMPRPRKKRFRVPLLEKLLEDEIRKERNNNFQDCRSGREQLLG